MEQSETVSRKVEESVAEERGYFFWLATVAVLFVCSNYFLGFSFLNTVSDEYVTQRAIASFTAIFYGLVKLTELFNKLFLSAWLLKMFGLLSTLLMLPLTVGLVVLFSLVFGNGGMGFFIAVVLAQALMFILRKAIFEPSTKILYQPLSESRRFAVQTRVSQCEQVALIGSGLLLTVFVLYGSTRWVVSALMVTLVLWILSTGPLFRKYRYKLRQILEKDHRESGNEMLANRIRKAILELPAENVASGVSMLGHHMPELLQTHLMDLVERPEDEVRIKALRYVAAVGLDSMVPTIERAVNGAVPEVQKEARRTIGLLRGTSCDSADSQRVARLAGSSRPEKRRRALEWLGCLEKVERDKWIFKLMQDRDEEIRRFAMIAAGNTGDTQFYDPLLDSLTDDLQCKAASFALANRGESLLPFLIPRMRPH